MMRKLFFYIATLSLLFPVYTSGWAAEGADHQAYKVKYYNLGSLFTPQETGVKRHLGGYRPLLIMDGSADILSNEYHGSVSLIEGENYSSNSSGVAFSARYDATDRISVLGAFGMNRNYLATDPLDGKTSLAGKQTLVSCTDLSETSPTRCISVTWIRGISSQNAPRTPMLST